MATSVKIVDSERILTEFKSKCKHVTDDMFLELVAGAQDVRNLILSRVANTKRAPWSYSRQKGKKRHYPSLPYNYPASDTGEFASSIVADIDIKRLMVEVGSKARAPYASLLEEGTTKMKKRPWLEPTVDDLWPNIKKNVFNIAKKHGDG